MIEKGDLIQMKVGQEIDILMEIKGGDFAICTCSEYDEDGIEGLVGDPSGPMVKLQSCKTGVERWLYAYRFDKMEKYIEEVS